MTDLCRLGCGSNTIWIFKINLILIGQGYEKSLYQWAFYLLKICPGFFGSFENLSERYEEKLSSIAAVKVALTLECAISNWNLQWTLLTIYVIFSYGQSLMIIVQLSNSTFISATQHLFLIQENINTVDSGDRRVSTNSSPVFALKRNNFKIYSIILVKNWLKTQ